MLLTLPGSDAPNWWGQMKPDLGGQMVRNIHSFGGIRRGNKIGGELAYNYSFLEKGGWDEIMAVASELIEARKGDPKADHINMERKASMVVQQLKGIGPKQSRNLWQALGLTRFEIPLDSRIIKWLNANGFPITLSASALSDENYYQFIMDGIQYWCKEAGVFPCVLDAVIFSSYDEDWPEDSLIW